jgi:N-carbamoylputrescine amidase
MARVIRCSLIQASNVVPADLDGSTATLDAIKQAMVQKHVAMVHAAAADGAQIVCLQEMFSGPYFCAEQTTRWHSFAEPIPHGPTVQRMCDLAHRLGVALIVPLYEVADAENANGVVFYNSAAVIARDGAFLGVYRKAHIPHAAPGFWEKYYFRPGNLGFPAFDLGFCKVGVYLCYDRHFPEGARVMGLNGAEIVFNPSAVIAGPNDFLWKTEPPALAVANGYFVAAINRVGTEAPWNLGQFFGQSYFCNPRGKIIAEASRDKDQIVTADLDLDLIDEARRAWPFFRDRRPDLYADLIKSWKPVSSE